MSYDLMFEAGAGRKLDRKSFRAYFNSRRHYEVGKGQALYQNEDTGVYFIFDEPEDEVVAFNLNYFRPHSFGLEAALELEAFAAAFEATVGDPQGEMDEGAGFSREAFLRGWNEGNRLGYRSLLKEQTEQIYTWPAQRIREVWEWNYGRPPEEARTAETLFVPGIFAVEVEGTAWSVAIWPPDCAILLPAVDAVLVPSEQREDCEDFAWVWWAEVLRVVSAYEEPAPGLARYRLVFEQWPGEVAAFLGQQRPPTGKLNGIGLEMVLDQELVEEASKG